MTRTDEILNAVKAELESAEKMHGPMHSPHEALAVIREEYLEFEEEVFKKRPVREALIEEAIQLAAMAVRFIKDCC
jgi:hypothetical protein